MSGIDYSTYLKRHKVDSSVLSHNDLQPDVIVVIPCYDEPGMLDMLKELQKATVGDVVIEVIVVVNSGEHTPGDIVNRNKETYEALKHLSSSLPDSFMLSPVLLTDVRRKHAGVGYARKQGMDLAICRFAESYNAKGIIASLDADTLVAKNYFYELYRCFQENPNIYGVIFKFEHAIEGEEYTSEVYEAIVHYELHLRYVNQALKYCGYPYVNHTVGSAFAVSAKAYVKHGGMNRRQGGEDFYFLHKLFPHGEFQNLNSTTVYPSSRPSLRVPFGTGPQINDFLKTQQLMSYKFEAFLELKSFLLTVPNLYDQSPNLSGLMADFFTDIELEKHLEEIRSNSASRKAFVKRFFVFFDAFKVVKYLNYAHQEYFEKNDIVIEAKRLLGVFGLKCDNDAKALLMAYRKIEGR